MKETQKQPSRPKQIIEAQSLRPDVVVRPATESLLAKIARQKEALAAARHAGAEQRSAFEDYMDDFAGMGMAQRSFTGWAKRGGGWQKLS